MIAGMTRTICFACVALCLLCPVRADEAAGADVDLNAGSGLSWYQLAGVLAAVGASGVLGWQGCKKMQAMRIEPQPLEVKAAEAYATRQELARFRGEVHEDFKRVHNRIDRNDQSTAEIKGQLGVIAANQEKILNLLLHRHD